MADFVEVLANILANGLEIREEAHLSENRTIQLVNMEDYEICDSKNSNTSFISHNAYSICLQDNFLYTQLSEQIYNYLERNNNSYIFIFRAIDQSYLDLIFKKFYSTDMTKFKVYFYPNINVKLELALAKGGITEEDGFIIRDNLDLNSRRSINNNEVIPDKYIYISYICNIIFFES